MNPQSVESKTGMNNEIPGALNAQTNKRNDDPRVDMQLRIRFQSKDNPTLEGEALAVDISPRGLRVESSSPIQDGEVLKLFVDSGDEEDGALHNEARVTWVRSRKDFHGNEIYEAGLHLDESWFHNERGRLASALAHLFALNNVEASRQHERVRVSLSIAQEDDPEQKLQISDLSDGGMQIRALDNFDLALKQKSEVDIALRVNDQEYQLGGQVAWVKANNVNLPSRYASFGVSFHDLEEDVCEILQMIQRGECAPAYIGLRLRSES